MLAATIAVVFVGLAVQLAVLGGMGDRRLIGDECVYLERGQSEDPHAPRLFLRPPVLPWLAGLCHPGSGPREPGRGVLRLRLVMALASVLAVGLTAIAGWRIGGPSTALLGAVILAVHPERVLLGCHIWPDTLLAATLAALMVVTTLPYGPAAALVAGGLCTIGVLSRIDFLFALPLLLAAWREPSGPHSAIATVALLAPPLMALVLLSVRNYRRYGIPLPDTTWAFNVMVARTQAHLDNDGHVEIERLVGNALAEWRLLTPTEAARQGLRALGDILRSPLRFGRGIVRRVLILFGPDTFIRHRLLPRNAAYPDLGERQRRSWEVSLVIASPLLFTVIVVGVAMGRRIPESFAWPSLGLAAAAILFHTRTRYRVALLPALSLIAAQDILRLGSLLDRPVTAVVVTVGGAALLWALLRIRFPDELRAGK